MTKLKSVPVVPFGCYMPWRLRGAYDDEIVEGAACWFCDREVAAPSEAKGKIVACIYCGLDRGFVDPVEIEP